ncbi:MAG: cyclic nucleotide-binding domain-containing protein [Actinomycetota bacterium]
MTAAMPLGPSAEDRAAVAGVPLFSELSPAELAAVIAEAEVRRYERGEVVFAQGDPADHLHVLLEGEVGLTGSLSGDHTVVEILEPGEIFIAAAVMTGRPALMGAVALKATRLMLLPAERLRRDLRANPGLSFAMLTSLAMHFRTLVHEVKDLKLRSAGQRLAFYLSHLADATSGRVVLRLPHNKGLIAARIGVRPETLSRVIAQLKHQGVAIKGHSVTIADIALLREYCHAGEDRM